MSNSDSEDLDEDELLQIALREQSQRDLSYQKGRPLKPVANLIQKPSPSPSSSLPPPLPQQKQPRFSNDSQHQRNPMPKQPLPPQQHQQRRIMEDDDDSEVELLSISSGDEDSSSKDPRAVAKGRVSKRDEGSWDGGEPDCWKRVDESELGRRVREMREMRAVPVAPKFEHKKSVMVIKGLNTLQSFPRGMECVDPLGLGIIDNKTLRLITDASESSPSKSERDYQDGSLREKLMYFSERFDPKLFLSRVHHDTTAADLEAGALALKTDLKGRTQQKKQLVKENFDCFVSCKTTIDDIESKLRRIEEDPEGAGTHHLFNSIQGVSSLANRAFQPLFERQTQAEKIRSVQGMLQRFRTLFNLPSTIRGSISKGEYDLAVREYRKAKSIELPSHVGILKRVLEEVEKVMHEFKGTLYKSMEDPQIDLTTVENTVRLLLELEPESDPVWHYLSIQNQRIRGLLEKCTLDHELRMETLHSEMHERALSEAKWREIQEGSSLSSDVNPNTNMAVDSNLVDLSGEEIDALRGRYIRRLTAVLIHHLPAFWKVALAVFSGKFAKVGDGKYSSHSLDEVAGMIRGTISVYEVKVQNAFRALEESNILRPYMSNTIKEITKACEAFEAKELVPSIAVMALRMLHLEITKVYILRQCSWMRASIEEIPKDESWVPVSILERNKSPYTISFLPLTFHSIMASAMDQISLMIQSLRSEVKKSEDMFVQFQEIQESVRLASLNCFLDFAGHLERLAGELSQRRLVKGSPQLQNGFYDESEENSSEVPDCVVDPHQRLLIVLSNIGFCKDELSRELYNKYKHIWLSSRVKEEEDSDLRDLVLHFSGLEEKVVAQYTFAKSHLIRTAAANYLLDAGFQWGGAPAVKGIRDAAVELLHTLVAVHAEVFAGAKPLLDKTLGILVEALIDTFLSLFHENKTKDLNSLDANGFCQLMLELEYFETILNPYFTPDARESLKSLQGVLLEKATESVTESIETPSHQRRATRGGEELLADDRQQGMTVSPDDLIALAQQYSSELLQGELERTRVNTACFIESIPLDSVPEPAKSAYNSFRGSIDSPSRKHRSTEAVGSPAFYRNRRY